MGGRIGRGGIGSPRTVLTLSGLSPRPILGLIKSTTCWLLSTSQIPKGLVRGLVRGLLKDTVPDVTIFTTEFFVLCDFVPYVICKIMFCI